MNIAKLAEDEIKSLGTSQRAFVLSLIKEARTCNKEQVKCSDILRKIKDMDLTLRQRVSIQFLVKDVYYAE